MDTYEFNELLRGLRGKLSNISSLINPGQIKQRLSQIEAEQNEPDFWADPARVRLAGQERARLEGLLGKFTAADRAVQDAAELFALARAEDDAATIQALFAEAGQLEAGVVGLELSMLLNGEDDAKNAIVSIHPGAGGTESNDWAGMLYRMYLRFCEREGFAVETLDVQEGEEAGLKDVSFVVRGLNAYGYLKAENGIHRLVRTSPFDSAGRRHTSFSSVLVSPEIDDEIAVDIEDKDIRIDYYRASGAGGQHVNKTESAVRITHLPTGLVAQCQNDRSQHKNKATAMKMLRSRIYELELMKQQGTVPEKSEIGWGHQIRSYVLFPYQQIKDNRSSQAYSQVEAILDGDLRPVIEGVLVALRGGQGAGLGQGSEEPDVAQRRGAR